MKIGLLETGRVDPQIEKVYGSYPQMFGSLLGPAISDLELPVVPVADGVLPGSPEDADAWLVIGSKHGVYDPLDWIAPLKAFLRDARAAGKPMIGVCFGHQLFAEAFGGRAEKSEMGWGCGVHRYGTHARPGWMAETPAEIAFHAQHQDQVVSLPSDATVLASSPFCRYAMVTYGDPERPDAVGIQPHPEFSSAYAAALVEQRNKKGSVPDDVADRALRSFGQPVDNALFATWMATYLGIRSSRTAA